MLSSCFLKKNRIKCLLTGHCPLCPYNQSPLKVTCRWGVIATLGPNPYLVRCNVRGLRSCVHTSEAIYGFINPAHWKLMYTHRACIICVIWLSWSRKEQHIFYFQTYAFNDIPTSGQHVKIRLYKSYHTYPLPSTQLCHGDPLVPK